MQKPSRICFMNRTLLRSLRLGAATVVASGVVTIAHAQVQSAGTLFVNVDVTQAALGSITAVTNNGTLGGFFQARGAANTVPRIAFAGASGVRGIQFDGDDYMQLVGTIGGPVTPPPAGLVGTDPTRTIEVWTYNPSI